MPESTNPMAENSFEKGIWSSQKIQAEMQTRGQKLAWHGWN